MRMPVFMHSMLAKLQSCDSCVKIFNIMDVEFFLNIIITIIIIGLFIFVETFWKSIKSQNIQQITDDIFPFKYFCCDSQSNPMDEVDVHHSTDSNNNGETDNDNEHRYHRETISGTNAGSFAYNIILRKIDSDMSSIFPSHALFNLAGSSLIRYNHHIEGTQAQQSFIQHLE